MSKEVMQQALNALEVMNNGWKYIRDSHGDLYGVGWDLAQDKAEASIAALTSTLALPDSEPMSIEKSQDEINIRWWLDKANREHWPVVTFDVIRMNKLIGVINKLRLTPQPAIAPRKGQQVSIDMSTGDDDATNRIFGELTGDQGSDGTWCAEFTSQNYAQPAIAQEPVLLTDDELELAWLDGSLNLGSEEWFRAAQEIKAAIHKKQSSQP